jgi:hypothetical protein
MNAVLSLIAALLPAGANSALIEKIIEALVALIPIIVQEYKDLVPIVKNIIVAIKSDPSTTAAQIDALDAMEAQLDADYDAAATAAAAEDAAAAGKPAA